ncbi:MAG: hypothetical protein M1834_003501 [Cirrosporium novae-zelandiae]|nr:MAG: hypothetical protein M1834_003501 [Cirrosporium novae-zelandiae]
MSENAFDTNDLNEALADVAERKPVHPGQQINADQAKIAHEKGWAEPAVYNYDAYNDSGPSGAEPTKEEGFPIWASNAQKYEWDDEYGDVGPRNEDLESQLFRHEFASIQGSRLSSLNEFEVTNEGPVKINPIREFSDAGLHPIMLENIMLCGYGKPTPVQAYTLPAVLKNHDVIACAQTGSGKTAAYLIPTLSKLMGKAKKLAAPRPTLGNFNPETDNARAEPLILVVAPTRELSAQIFDDARRFCYRSMLRPCVIYGGAPAREQRAELARGCDVLIATPGRLIDFMEKPHILSLSRVKYTIIDEADEMLQPDWEADLGKIFAGGDTNEDADHVYMMFSATFNKETRKLAKKFMATDHMRIRVGRAGSTHVNVEQQIIATDESMKRQALYDILIAMPPARTMIFVNNKKSADLLDDYLYNNGLPSTSIHSDRTQREREDALRAFKTATAPILIATGVSARGIDVRSVMHVINYDLPSVEHGGIDEYIHRIGRTARIGNQGLATSFYSEERDEPIAQDLVKILIESKQKIPEFFQQYVPEGGKLDFDDESDNEGDEETGGDSAWGSGGNAWGASTDQAAPAESGWGAAGGSKPAGW